MEKGIAQPLQIDAWKTVASKWAIASKLWLRRCLKNMPPPLLSERVSGMIAKGMMNWPTQGAVLPLERLEVWQSCGPLNGGQNMQPPWGPSLRFPRPREEKGRCEGGEIISQKRNMFWFYGVNTPGWFRYHLRYIWYHDDTRFRRKMGAITSENVPLTFCLRNLPCNNYFKVTRNFIYTRSTHFRLARKVNSDLEPATGEFLMTIGTTEPSNH